MFTIYYNYFPVDGNKPMVSASRDFKQIKAFLAWRERQIEKYGSAWFKITGCNDSYVLDFIDAKKL